MVINWAKVLLYEDFKKAIDAVVLEYGHKTAIACIGDGAVDRRITYKELLEIVNSIIAILQNIGIKRAQRVAIITPPTAEAVVLNLALAYGGYTNVLVDDSLPIVECNKLLKYADIDAIITTDSLYSRLDCGIKCEVPAIKINNNFTYELFEGSISECKKKSCEPYDEEVIAIVFSSGTTSEMKGCMITYSSILYAQKYMLQYTNLNSEATFLDVLPSSHIAGYSSAMSCLLTGTEVGFIAEVSAEKLLSGFLNYNPTNFIMIPKVYEVIKNKVEAAIDKKMIIVKWYAMAAMKICGFVRRKTGMKWRFLTKPIWKAALGKNMKICGCGTLPCSEEVMRFYLDLGIDFVNVYGASETGFPIVAANCNEKYPMKGAGNIKQFREVQVIIAEPDDEGIGEIRVKTPLIMKGYFREEELSKQAYDDDGYFKTGDLGYIDEEGYLYITGRSKEAIVLHNGKKISPLDVDKYYQEGAQNLLIASCGVSTSEGYDNVYLFVEKANHTDEEVEAAISSLEKMSRSASLYKVEKVLSIDKIPLTSIGKVKRYLLKKHIDESALSVDEKKEAMERAVSQTNREELLLRIISKYISEKVVTLESDIKEDLGIDSLSIFELGMDIENELGIDIVNRWERIERVEDILKNTVPDDMDTKIYDINEFPLKRKLGDLAFIKHFGIFSRFMYRLEAVGIENIPQNENLLFCPNHESYFDAMWIVATLEQQGFDISRFNCLAAEHLKDKIFMKKAFRALGGIPIDRSGNVAPAMKRVEELLKKETTYMIIHPEGTRSRSGKLGEFKLGAAQLALDAGVRIVPVCIDGAYEIYPPNVKLPRCFKWKEMRKYPLRITFGEAIDVEDTTKEEITETIKNFIEEQKAKK
ncbi:MAG: AMP-binding protein [Acetatifactor sp.]